MFLVRALNIIVNVLSFPLLLLMTFSLVTNSCIPLLTSSPHKEPSKATKPNNFDLQKATVGAFAAMTIASNVFLAPAADAVDTTFGALSSSSTVLSEKVVREGLYRDYEVDIVQETDDARSTFKAAKETKSKKGTLLLERNQG
jgi:hypothetical protein